MLHEFSTYMSIFKPTQKADPWTGTYDAFKEGSTCITSNGQGFPFRYIIYLHLYKEINAGKYFR